MTAKNRTKHNSSEKSSSPNHQDDVAKKSQKAVNGVSGPAPQGPGSGSSLKLYAALCYIVLVAAAGFAAFYLQQVLEEVHQISAKNQESLKRNAELTRQMEGVLQQVESLRSNVDGLESALGITRVELEGATSRLRKGEVETRRVEEALHKLQNDLLRDLSEGIREVKEAREQDFSSLEKTVEERLAELSRSIAGSVAEFTEAQGEAKSQLADFKARLGEIEDPALIKQELSAIVDAVAELGAAKQAAEASADSLREQIGTVRAELQTRNQEVASLSQEVGAVRSLVQETAGSLRQSVAVAEAGVQEVKDKAQTLEDGLEQATGALQSVERELREASAEAQTRSDGLEVRVKASEDSGESLAASVSELTSKVESILAKYDSHESTLAAQGQAAEKSRTGLQEELQALGSSFEELQSNMAALGAMQTKLSSEDSILGQQVEGVEKRLAALEGSVNAGSETPKQLENLRSLVAGLENKAAKLEGHERAISDLQGALRKTTESLEALSKAPNKIKK